MRINHRTDIPTLLSVHAPSREIVRMYLSQMPNSAQAHTEQQLPHSRNVSHLPSAGKFGNPWPGVEFHGVADFLKWVLFKRPFTRKEPRRTIAEFPQATPRFERPRAASDLLTITWVGHTTFLVQIGGMNVLLDPVWSDRASPIPILGPKRRTPPGIPFETLPPIDLVVISHDHYDHLDLQTVRRIVRTFPTARWIAPLGVARWLRARGARVDAELDWWESATVAGIALTCTPAQHFSGRYPTNRNSTLWCGWVLRSATHTLFFAGDTAYHPEFAEIASTLGPFDAAILPIGAYEPRWFMSAVHMDAIQAVDAYADLTRNAPAHPTLFVASHWGTFKLTDEPMDEPPILARQAWLARGLPTERLWIAQHGETRMIGA
jgi:N-acyl-phosphatidylethanolamine-hydrolysing phospholipase D